MESGLGRARALAEDINDQGTVGMNYVPGMDTGLRKETEASH